MRNRTTFDQHIRIVGVIKIFDPFGERVGHDPKACQRDFSFKATESPGSWGDG